MQQIKLLQLKGTNFKSYEDLEFNFSENKLILLVGDNGSGKTTCIDAVLFCLYDHTTKGRGSDDIIRKRSGKNAFVSLTFQVGSDLYKVENYRKHKKFKNGKFLYKNTKLISEERTEINKLIEQLILPFTIFKNCLLFTNLGNEKTFVEQTHSGQKQLLDRMLDLEHFDEFYEKSKIAITENQNQFKLTETSVSTLDESVINYNSMLETEKNNSITIQVEKNQSISNIKFEQKDIGNKITQLIPHLEFFQMEKDKLDDMNQRKNSCDLSLQHSQEIFSNNFNNLKQLYKEKFENSKLYVINQFSNDLSDLQNKQNKMQMEFENLAHQKSNIYNSKENKYNRVFNWIKQKQNQINEIKTQTDDNFNQQNFNYQQIITDLTNSITQYGNSITDYNNNINKPDSTCPTCQQILQTKGKQFVIEKMNELQNAKQLELTNLDDMRTKIQNLQNQKQNDEAFYRNRLNVLNKRLLIIKKAFNNYKTITKNEDREIYNQHQEQILVNTGQIENINKHIEAEILKVKATITKEGQIETNKLLQQKQNEEVLLKQNLQEITKQRDQQQIVMNNLEHIKSEHDSLQTELKEKQNHINDTIIQFDNMITQQNQRVTNLENKLIKLTNDKAKLEAKLISFQDELSILEFWKTAFSSTGIKSILLDEAIPTLNKEAKRLSAYSDTIRVSFDSQKLLKSGESRNKFSICALQTKNLTDDIRDFSSGEKKIVDIITLLSLKKLLETMHKKELNVLFLDELLDNLDSVNIDIVNKLLRKLAEDKCITLISHTQKDNIEADEILSCG